MQTVCPKCSNPLLVDDAKVPSGPFVLRCPKCQGTMKLQGKGQGNGQAKAEPKVTESRAASPPPSAVSSSAAGNGGPAVPSASPPPGLQPPPVAGPTVSSPTNGSESARALLSVGPPEPRGALAALLARQGYAVDLLDAPEKLIQLQQGDYAVVVTERVGSNGGGNGAAQSPNLYQRVFELAPELRRRLFVVVVGSEYKSGDPNQAFATVADLVLNANEAAVADGLFRHVLSERTRLFQAFLEVESRLEEGRL